MGLNEHHVTAARQKWRHIDPGVSSALISTESLRTLDRVRIRVSLSDVEVAKRRATILNLIESLELIEIDSIVLDRAAQPTPTELGTLDAIHLASALLWKDAMRIEPVMATHDEALVWRRNPTACRCWEPSISLL